MQFTVFLLQYCLLQHHAGITPEFQPCTADLGTVVRGTIHSPEIGRHWQRRVMQAAPLGGAVYGVTVFNDSPPRPDFRDTHQRAQQLRLEVARLVLRFREKGNVRFSDEQEQRSAQPSLLTPGAEPKFIRLASIIRSGRVQPSLSASGSHHT